MHIHVVVHPLHVLYVLLLVQILSSHVQRGTDPAGRLDRSKARQVDGTKRVALVLTISLFRADRLVGREVPF